MKSSLFKNDGWLYGLAFLIALGFRLIQLGATPLTDSEATLALQALHVAQGQAPLLGSQTAYVLFTSILFAARTPETLAARAPSSWRREPSNPGDNPEGQKARRSIHLVQGRKGSRRRGE